MADIGIRMRTVVSHIIQQKQMQREIRMLKWRKDFRYLEVSWKA